MTIERVTCDACGKSIKIGLNTRLDSEVENEAGVLTYVGLDVCERCLQRYTVRELTVKLNESETVKRLKGKIVSFWIIIKATEHDKHVDSNEND